MDNNQIENILFKLCSAYGVSGDEHDMCGCVAEITRDFMQDISIGEGTVRARLASDDALPEIVLDAHIDQIGFAVTGYEAGGFVRVAPCGGIDPRLLPGLPVILHGTEEVRGVFCSVPPHLIQGGEQAAAADETYIDTGIAGEELERLVPRGSRVSFYAPPKKLTGSRITSGALDNRAGAAVIICALKMLDGRKPAYNITAAFTAQEELGCRGAVTTAYACHPDCAIAVDVSFALSPGESKHSCGILGKGPMIGFSPVLDREMSLELCSIAERKGIPYQREIMGGLTSTNADKYSVSRGGVRTALISVPLRYMHSPVEIIDIEDIKASAQVLCTFLLGGSL